jgi:hypothetical protein
MGVENITEGDWAAGDELTFGSPRVTVESVVSEDAYNSHFYFDKDRLEYILGQRLPYQRRRQTGHGEVVWATRWQNGAPMLGPNGQPYEARVSVNPVEGTGTGPNSGYGTGFGYFNQGWQPGQQIDFNAAPYDPYAPCGNRFDHGDICETECAEGWQRNGDEIMEIAECVFGEWVMLTGELECVKRDCGPELTFRPPDSPWSTIYEYPHTTRYVLSYIDSVHGELATVQCAPGYVETAGNGWNVRNVPEEFPERTVQCESGEWSRPKLRVSRNPVQDVEMLCVSDHCPRICTSLEAR